MSALVKEVAAALLSGRYGDLLCTPTVEMDRGVATLTVRLAPTDQSWANQELAIASLFHELQHVCDIATMRALCARFGIESEKLEALLPPKE